MHFGSPLSQTPNTNWIDLHGRLPLSVIVVDIKRKRLVSIARMAEGPTTSAFCSMVNFWEDVQTAITHEILRDMP